MTRIVICGGPRTGKTTLAQRIADEYGDHTSMTVAHTDDLIAQTAHLGKDGWSEASRLASEWLNAPGPWIIEGVAVCRALRKWRGAHPGERPPVDRLIRLLQQVVPTTPKQAAMAKGEQTVMDEIADWLGENGIAVEFMSMATARTAVVREAFR